MEPSDSPGHTAVAADSLPSDGENLLAVRLVRMKALAEETFGDSRKAHRWLHRELSGLDGRRPIDLARTQVGTRMVESLLASIAWGAPV